MDESTINYYNDNAQKFTDETINVDFREIQEKFLSCLPKDAVILDLGCGSGRDTKYFLDRGYRVDAVDGSRELCRLAAAYTGIPVRQMMFDELDACEKYDGIWACASVLHVPQRELPDIMRRMIDAAKPDGIIYMSFKYGDHEGLQNGRYYTCLTEKSFSELLGQLPENNYKITVQAQWISGDVRTDRGAEQWLNIILRKTKS